MAGGAVTGNVPLPPCSNNQKVMFRDTQEGLVDVINRKFIKASDFNLQVVAIGGARCSNTDKDQRKVLWVLIYKDGYESEALSCSCK